MRSKRHDLQSAAKSQSGVLKEEVTFKNLSVEADNGKNV